MHAAVMCSCGAEMPHATNKTIGVGMKADML